jgi:hypothetical protein
VRAREREQRGKEAHGRRDDGGYTAVAKPRAERRIDKEYRSSEIVSREDKGSRADTRVKDSALDDG